MNAMDVGLVLLRLAVGLTFAAHGAQKAFGWWKGPGWSGWQGAVTRMGFRPTALWASVSVAAELAGGVLLALGLLAPLAAMALIGQSVVIILKVHLPKGFWNRDGGYEFPLSLGAGAVAIGLGGPGTLSLDQALGVQPPDAVRLALVVVGLAGGALSYAASVARPAQATQPAAAPPGPGAAPRAGRQAEQGSAQSSAGPQSE